ncbi:MAG: YcgN family cysteine cluster protein [Gammaproteobacteria bacterium]|nr:YcgN family cysteine cluster protein [Gammaproteobacteria bacterium]
MNKFWETKTLGQMTLDEWEALCDGCGLCCLVKIEDEDSGEVYNTSVSCFLLETASCRCGDYNSRFSKAPMCTRLTPDNLAEMDWLPESCAYKRLKSGLTLPAWHYLLTNDRDAVHEAGISARWFALSEEFIHPDQLADFVITPDGE